MLKNNLSKIIIFIFLFLGMGGILLNLLPEKKIVPKYIKNLQESDIFMGYEDLVMSVAFGPKNDNNVVLASGSADGRIKLWSLVDDYTKTTEKTDIKTNSKVVRKIAFSPDGKLLANVSDDNTLFLYLTV